MSDLGLRMSNDSSPGGGSGHRRGGTRRRKKKRRGGKKRSGVAVLLALVVVVGVVGGGGYLAVHYIKKEFFPTTADYADAGTGSVTVDIPTGTSLTGMGQILHDKGVVASVKAFTDAASANPQSATIQPGIYTLHTHMKASLAVTMLLDPSSHTGSTIVVVGNQRAATVYQALATKLKVTDDVVRAAALKVPIDPVKAQSLGLPAWVQGTGNAPGGVDTATARLDGLLAPGTYTLQTDSTPGQILGQMVDAGLTRLAGYSGQAQALNMTPYQLLTMASIVQAEGRTDDYPKVGRVILNRLAKGMKLQDDSTVLYAQSRAGTLQISQKDLNFNNPYNTYVVKGLPPGPILTVDDAALNGAANPAQGNWLFFVTVNPDTGETVFTDSQAEFAQAVQQYRQWQAAHPSSSSG